ncbi:MAG TPA: Tim44 domain-containing protein [Methylomirabilota bacterium]|nr:Tim44 domain-containing protein [Methylomirabilota bacterium]
MKRSTWIAFLGLLAMTALAAATIDAEARARSGGSRGSRTYSAPVRPDSTSPTAPSRTATAPSAPAPQRPGLLGGFGGMLGGLLLGGLLGGLLFGNHGFGIGLLDVLLIGGGLALLMTVLRRRREEPRPAYAMAGGGGPYDRAPAADWQGGVATVAAPAAPSDLERGIGHIRTLDARFDPGAFAEVARTAFLDVQRAVGARDVAPLRERLTPEMFAVLQGQVDEVRAARRTSHVEDVRFDRVDVSEAWQESGRDFVTVYLTGSLLDYTVSDTTREVVNGSRTAPQAFEEFWTFTRPVGPNGWRLSAIQAT